MDFRTYLEESEEAWMWVYTADRTGDSEAVNMEHVVSIRVEGGSDEVEVVATTIFEERVVLKYCGSGGEGRDFLKDLLAAANERESFRR